MSLRKNQFGNYDIDMYVGKRRVRRRINLPYDKALIVYNELVKFNKSSSKKTRIIRTVNVVKRVFHDLNMKVDKEIEAMLAAQENKQENKGG